MSVVEDDSGNDAGGEELPDKPSGEEHRGSIFSRLAVFLRGSWRELQRVQWPDRSQVAQATAVVLGFVAIAGAYLGLADYISAKLVNLIL